MSHGIGLKLTGDIKDVDDVARDLNLAERAKVA